MDDLIFAGKHILLRTHKNDKRRKKQKNTKNTQKNTKMMKYASQYIYCVRWQWRHRHSLVQFSLTHCPQGDVCVILKNAFELILHNSSLGIHCKIALIRMLQYLTHKKSILVHTMARCRQATRHYLNQYGPRQAHDAACVIRPQESKHYTSTCFIWLILIQWDNFAVAVWKHQGMVIA